MRLGLKILDIPNIRVTLYENWHYMGIKIYNKLPEEILESKSLHIFKTRIQHLLLDIYLYKYFLLNC